MAVFVVVFFAEDNTYGFYMSEAFQSCDDLVLRARGAGGSAQTVERCGDAGRCQQGGTVAHKLVLWKETKTLRAR